MFILTREEDVEAASDRILSNEYIEDVEGDLIEEITHDLEDKRGAFVTRRQCADIIREDKLLKDVAHGGYMMTFLLFLK